MMRLFTAVPLYIFLFFSCKAPQQLQYFSGPYDTASLSTVVIPEPRIQKGDLLGIMVYSDDPQASAFFNQLTIASPLASTATGVSNAGTASELPAYLVDNTGSIQFQSIGRFRVEGFTKAQLSDTLRSRLRPYLSNPYSSVRFLNHKVTIIGEVNRQGVYNMPSDRMNMFELLGLSGDINEAGLRNDVTVIREIDGKREVGQLDLTKPEALNSPYFNLMQNDVVIVRSDTNKQTLSEQRSTRRLSLIAAVTSVITSVALVVNIFVNNN